MRICMEEASLHPPQQLTADRLDLDNGAGATQPVKEVPGNVGAAFHMTEPSNPGCLK